jgi:hypothetical protein
LNQDAVMKQWRKLILPGLVVAASAAFPSAAQAEFCGIAGQSPQEIAANVARTGKFKRIGSNARYLAYANKADLTTLTVTMPANKAHPAVACRRAFRQKDGEWYVKTDAKCAASNAACKAMMGEFRELDAQMKQALEKANSKP